MALQDINIPNASADVVSVLDENFKQVFANARPLKIKVIESSKPMEHPVETGATITDHRIILPVEIEMSMILRSDDYRSTYAQIKKLFLDATLLSVQTKATTYTKMLISDIPHDEDPDMFDTISVAVKLKEVLFVEAQFGQLTQVKNPKNASTTNRGELQPTNAPNSQGSLLYRTFVKK